MAILEKMVLAIFILACLFACFFCFCFLFSEKSKPAEKFKSLLFSRSFNEIEISGYSKLVF